jgi:hypothetical protein
MGVKVCCRSAAVFGTSLLSFGVDVNGVLNADTRFRAPTLAMAPVGGAANGL